MENAVLNFASMEELMAFKQTAKISSINWKFDYESNTFEGHLSDADIEVAISDFSAVKITKA